MKRNIALILIGSAFFLQLFFIVRTHYVQSNPVEVLPLDQSGNQLEASELNDSSVSEDTSEAFESDLNSDQNQSDMSFNVNEFDTINESVDEESLLFEFAPNDFSSYLSMNPDFTGWLSIDDTAVDYPVVRGRDNEFYLDHNFYREKHPFGAIFMDYRNIGNGQDNHTIIYGHYTPNGHMFADLEKYLSEEFFNENRTITFRDIYTERTYEIFSVHVAPADAYFINESFRNPDMTDYLTDLNERSFHQTEIEFTDDTRVLTLISCNYTVDDGRIYIHAIEVDE